MKYRISERVSDQFEALMQMTSFSELIPWDLNILDERVLEFLIDGTPEIDVYAPSTPCIPRADYPHLLVTTGANSQTTEDAGRRTKSSSGSGSASEAGRRNANPACSSPQPGPPESLSADSRIYWVLTDSPSRSQAIPHNFQ